MSDGYRPHRVYLCKSWGDREGTLLHEGPSLRVAYQVATTQAPNKEKGERIRFDLGSSVPPLYRVEVTETREATAFIVAEEGASLGEMARELTEDALRRVSGDVETDRPERVDDLAMWLGDSAPVWLDGERLGGPDGGVEVKGWRELVEKLIAVESAASYEAECERRREMGLGDPIPVLAGQGVLECST